MKVPYVHDQDVIKKLSGQGVKLLFFWCSRPPPPPVAPQPPPHPNSCIRGVIEHDCQRLGIGRKAWARAARELADIDLVDYSSSTTGYSVRIRHTGSGRFTWVPSFLDDRLFSATPRACKALLIICRVLQNSTGTIRMKLDTLAHRLGRSVRTALLALRELKDRMIMSSIRTGRSSWFCVNKPDKPDPQGKLFDGPDAILGMGGVVGGVVRPKIAHHSGLLLRLLSLTTHSHLSKVLAQLRKSKTGQSNTGQSKAKQITSAVSGTMTPDRRYLRNRLVEMAGSWGGGGGKMDRDLANVLVLEHGPDEIRRGLDLAIGRRIANFSHWFQTILGRDV